MTARYYDYDKATMLNAAYDVFDSIGAMIQHVNSNLGTIIFQMDPQIHLKMNFEVRFPKKETEISFLDTKNQSDLNASEQQCAQIIFEELDAKLKNAHITRKTRR